MLKEIFLQKRGTQLQTVNNAIITLGDIDDSGKGKRFKSRFIQAGLAGYPGQYGNVLVRKEALDSSLNTIIGAPVIINHKDITKDNADNERVGVISNAYYNEKDGWYWCEGVIWDETAINLVQDNGWSVSCSYDYLEENDEGGLENNVPYDREFTKLNFVHLALVDNPRYERANIVFNSKSLNNLPEEKESNVTLLEDLKKLIQRAENSKGDEMINNEKVDKRKLIDEIGGILKGKVDEELWRTIIGKAEKIAYDKSEAGTADNDMSDMTKGRKDNEDSPKNEKIDKRDLIRKIMAIAGKHEDNEDVRTIAKLAEQLAYDKSEAGTSDNRKVKNESEKDRDEVDELEEDLEKDVRNKCKNSVNNRKEDFFQKLNEVYNSANQAPKTDQYISRADRLKAAEEYFSK